MRILALLILIASPALARDPILNPPIDCDLTQGCYIPRYVDVDPSPGATDYACGTLTGDGHKGTDFAVPSRAAMEAGVPVHPAAPGTVRRIRDGEPDTGVSDETRASIEGKECGNGVVVSHGGGWETQYCHLKNGSIRVEPGQRVGTSAILGEVGLSGKTTFPHVHLSLRKDGAVVDPFAPDAQAQCGLRADTGLWQKAPPYRPGGLIALGFWDGIPDYAKVRAGTAGAEALPADAPALVVWAFAFGGRPGDKVALTISGPGGEVISETVALDTSQALYFRAIGRRAPPEGWPAGPYDGTATLLRNGAPLESRTTSIAIGD